MYRCIEIMQLHFLFAREAIAAIPYKTLMDLHATIYNDSMPELFSSFLIKSVYKWDIVSWRGNTFDSKQSTRISSQMCEAVERKSQGQSNAKLLIPVYTHTVSCRHNGMMMCMCFTSIAQINSKWKTIETESRFQIYANKLH